MATSDSQKCIQIASSRLTSGDNVADIELQAHRDARKRVEENRLRDAVQPPTEQQPQPPPSIPSPASSTPSANAPVVSNGNNPEGSEMMRAMGPISTCKWSIIHLLTSGMYIFS
jgi:hypothetical protein